MAQNYESLRRYYDASAENYDDMYTRKDRPLWQKELKVLAEAQKKALRGRNVLEVACGTGFWTEIAAQVAKHVTAIDVSQKMLEVARKKHAKNVNVEYLRGDAYALSAIPGNFEAGLANFWFSHVPKSRTDEFLNSFHKRLGTTAVVFMADNIYVPGIGGKLITKRGYEDTFKRRKLSDGSTCEVLKNYYGQEAIRRLLAPKTVNLQVHESKYFWWATYLTP